MASLVGWRPLRWRVLVLFVLLVAAAVGGALSGRYLRFDLPDVRSLEDYTPPVMSRVLDADGEVVATFAEERRMLVPFADIPPHFLEALIATEDSSFYRHTGIDFKGIARAAWHDVLHFRLAQGASTLTQQLARNLFLTRDKTVRRKAQEAMLALEIERQYTKEEILHFYCNQIYMGHGRYGIEAAARLYFGKPARQLSLTESALLAGVIQRPEALSPLKNPERAVERRNHVLGRMAAEGFLAEDEARAAMRAPLTIGQPHRDSEVAPYFVEEVRRLMQRDHGSSAVYKAGYETRTTLDVELQQLAERAVEHGLRELDKRQGWRGASERVPAGSDPASYAPPSWAAGVAVGDVADGVVVEAGRETARVRVGPFTGTLDREAIAWTRKKEPREILSGGDLVRVRVVAADDPGDARLALEQEPQVEAALVALDPSSGAIRALVGGFDFDRSEFNRAVQARRQTGSAFKPIVYAAALSSGWTLADTLLDEPTVFVNRRLPEPYQPENYSRKYYETLTLRAALEKSANIATVKLEDQIGYDAVIDLARRLGISSELHPFPSLALGAFEVSLLELTAAYGAFANQGVYVEPFLIEEVRDRNGVVVERFEPEVRDAVRPQVAFLMNRVLGGVITDGTGGAAASLGLPLAGKTGTTDESTDAWFIGYSPRLAVGVWVGFDERRSLGSRETGAVAALPIWQAFMERAAEGSTADFPRPPGIVVVAIDRATGLRANAAASCASVMPEYFLEGTEPTVYCSAHEHRRLALPYPFQRYAVSADGRLVIPRPELLTLLESEPTVFLTDGGRSLEAHTSRGTVTVGLEAVAGEPPAYPAWLLERFDPAEWFGRDGRRARVVLIR